jgi:hypothetical protein
LLGVRSVGKVRAPRSIAACKRIVEMKWFLTSSTSLATSYAASPPALTLALWIWLIVAVFRGVFWAIHQPIRFARWAFNAWKRDQ